MDQETLLNVEGMDCANCALTITRTLQKEGFSGVKVDFTTGEVRFNEHGIEKVDKAVSSVNDLGYKVVNRSDKQAGQQNGTKEHAEQGMDIPFQFILCLALSIPLTGHMFLDWKPLHDPWIQFALCTPVMMVGWLRFGRSAWKSVRAGVPNMDVLVTIGSTAAYVYSILQFLYAGNSHHVEGAELYFETAASIITLIMLGNLIEHRSVRKTTTSLQALKKLQPETVRKIMMVNGQETIVEQGADSLSKDDVLLISEGSRVPADGIITEGHGSFDESMMTGESLPVVRDTGQRLISGTLCIGGSVRMRCEATGSTSTLSSIIQLVRDAQHDKPGIQRIGDRISAIFVPVVVAISLLTFFVSYFFLDVPLRDSVMHAIAVLVISCPCAMGLATPTAVVVGIGRAAREGVLIKGGKTIEQLAKADVFVFDKTGTLTTGEFRIAASNAMGISETELFKIVYSLELESNHPIALSLSKTISAGYPAMERIRWKDIQEDKGVGIHGWTEDGALYSIGSYQLVAHTGIDDRHALYVTSNNRLIGTIDIKDDIKAGAQETISSLQRMGKRVILMSGDREERCREVADAIGIREIHARLTPKGKLDALKALGMNDKTVMVGDGINDAPALAAAGTGVSMSGATDVAMQSAQVILLHRNDLTILLKAWQISKLTYTTILQNLFWAFIYNVIAIPFAAAGYLNPMFGAISMAVSDVIVVGNSLRLNYRKTR